MKEGKRLLVKEGERMIHRRNRTTTYQSLLGVVFLLLSDDMEVFSDAYKLATHDRGGDGIFLLIQNYEKDQQRKNESRKRWVQKHKGVKK